MPLLSDADLLARLVGFDSVSRNSNLPLADFLCEYLDRPGVGIQRNPSPDSGKTNLVVTIGPEGNERRKGLVLSGHMDVVPADEPDWHSDPFVLTESGESYVGRGASDMKGFLANYEPGLRPVGATREDIAIRQPDLLARKPHKTLDVISR